MLRLPFTVSSIFMSLSFDDAFVRDDFLKPLPHVAPDFCKNRMPAWWNSIRCKGLYSEGYLCFSVAFSFGLTYYFNISNGLSNPEGWFL